MKQHFYAQMLGVCLGLLLLNSYQLLSQADSPCECITRWEEGGHWNDDGTINESGNVPDPQGIIRCGNAADTQSGVTSCIDPSPSASSCNNRCVYNSNSFDIDLSGITCFDPNNLGTDPGVTTPTDGCDIMWLQLDVRPFAGTWQFQLVGGSQEYDWALYASTTVDTDGDPLTGCNDLSLQECGSEFSSTWSTITTPDFGSPTNYYMAVWNTGPDCTDILNVNFKFRNGCGDATCLIQLAEAGTNCNPDGSYDVCFDVEGVNGEFEVLDNTGSATSVPANFTLGLYPDGPFYQTVCVTYPSAVDYDVTINGVKLSNSNSDCVAELNFMGTGLQAGCTDPSACNFDVNAVCDDNSCTYIPDGECDCDGNVLDACGDCGGSGVAGCTDDTACNYNPSATCEDNSCTYIPDGECDCDGNVLDACGDCGGSGVAGCTDDTACNYNPSATCEDNSCTYIPDGECDCDGNVLDACGDCGGSGVAGCTDETACNYNPSATCEDNSCTYIPDGECDCDGNVLDACGDCGGSGVAGCTDETACNYDPSATCDDDSCSNADPGTCTTTCTDGVLEAWDPVSCQCVEVCDNVDTPGSIAIDAYVCGPAVISVENISPAAGGCGDIEYVWLQSPINVPNTPNNPYWTLVSGETGASYTTNLITETTCFLRCSRTSTCNTYMGESNIVCVEIMPCEEYCTFTQGYYGNPEGTQNGQTTTEILNDLLAANGGSITIGSNNQSLTISDAECIISLLPGGGASKPLPTGSYIANPGNDCLEDTNFNQVKKGVLRNNLAAQTLTLSLNVLYDPTLNYLNLSESCLPIPASILAVATTVQDLIDLANAALGGGSLGNYTGSLGTITATLGLINDGYDECRSVDEVCGSGSRMDNTTTRSSMDCNEHNVICQLNVAPSITRDLVRISYVSKHNMAASIQVLNAQGNPLQQYDFEAQQGDNYQTINLSNLSTGLYFVTVQVKGEILVQKVVKAN